MQISIMWGTTCQMQLLLLAWDLPCWASSIRRCGACPTSARVPQHRLARADPKTTTKTASGHASDESLRCWMWLFGYYGKSIKKKHISIMFFDPQILFFLMLNMFFWSGTRLFGLPGYTFNTAVNGWFNPVRPSSYTCAMGPFTVAA